MVKGNVWTPWKTERRRCVRNLTMMRNRLNEEAVFDQDFKDIKTLDTAIQMIRNKEYDNFHSICPVCGESLVAQGDADAVAFYGIGNADPNAVGKIEDLRIQLCYGCGWYALDGF